MKWIRIFFEWIANPRIMLEELPASTTSADNHSEELGGKSVRLTWRDVLFNLPLMMGLLIVLVLFVIVLFGPVWAPQNPYIAGQHGERYLFRICSPTQARVALQPVSKQPLPGDHR